MSDSQDASLDEDVVFPRVSESSPEFYYSEPRRRALECLLSAGPAAFHTQLSLERVNNFLSESEISELHNHVTDFVPTEVPLSSWKREPAECLSDFSERYWPEYSDVPAPCLDLGWPDDGGGWKGITRATVYTHPPHEREPPIREVVRRGIQEASKTLISPYTPTRPLRSACTRRLALPPLRSPASRARSFSTLAPQWWNDLPTDVRTAQSLTTFRRLLKTHLFKQHL
ncbi:UNVERIFIED_CONTAM: hypothetical protein FKN15_005099 [Acipenser sinensis]